MFKRRWRRILVLVVVVLAVLVALAPWLAGLPPVRRYVAGRLADALGRPVALEGLTASWTDGVALSGVRIANKGATFGSEPALEARRIHVDDALTGLLFGDGARHVVVEGLVVRVEEQAGGRTNLDDLLPRPAKPRPPPLPGEEVAPPPPRALQVTLKDATFTLRRLPVRPQPRPIDPFREDPVVLDAEEGAVVLGVEALDLDYETGPDGAHARFAGGLVFDAERGRVDGDLRFDDDGVRGRVEAQGLDLAWLAPLLGAEVAGRVDLTLRCDSRGELDAKARVEKLHIAGPRLPELDEDWLTVALVARRADGALTVERAEVKTASDTVRLTASGDAAGFRADARLPLRHVFAPTGDVPADGDATTTVTGRITDGRWDLAGTLAVAGFVLSDPKLRRAPEDLLLTFDVTATRAELALRKLVVDALACKLDVAGTTTLARPVVCDLRAEGIEVDLARVFPLVRPFLRDAADVALSGQVTGHATVRRDAAGDVTAAGRLGISDLVASGWLAEEFRRARAVVELDADLRDDGETLVVRAARLDDLRGQGTLHLRGGALRDAHGELKGVVEIPPVAAALAGLDQLGGTATVDLTARTTGSDVRVEGSLAVADLRVDDFARDRVAVRGHMERRAHWLGELALDAGPGVAGAGSVAQVDGGWSGNVTPKLELAALADLGLPAGFAGTVGGRADVRFANGRWRARGDLTVANLVAPVGERTVRDRAVSLSAEIVQNEEGWAATVSRARLVGHRLDVEVPRASLAAGGFTGTVRVKGPLDEMAALLDVEPARGAATLTADLVRGDGALAFDGRLEVNDFEFGGERFGRAVLVAEGKRADGTVDVDAFTLTLDDATLKGHASIGAAADLVVQGSGDFAALARHLPEVAGKGRFALDAKATLPVRPRDGPAAIDGTLRADTAIVRGIGLDKAVTTLRAEARRHGDDWKDVSVALVLTADEARRGNVRYVELRGDATGAGDWRADGGGAGVGFRTQVRCKEATAGEVRFAEIRLQSAGRSRGKKFPRLRDGDFACGRLVTGAITWTDARGRFESDGTTVRLTGIEATVNDGSVQGEFEFGLEAPVRWQTSFRAKGVKLTEQLGRPLSLMVPLLRLDAGRAERHLQGRVDGEATLASDGSSWDALRASMSGRGFFDFTGVSVHGSLVLPLLSLRFDKAVLGRPTRFEAFRANFTITRGRVRTDPFRLGAAAFSIGVEGECGLDGTLDFVLRPTLPPIPLALKGTWDRPRVRPTIRLPFK